jgi:hypothetical protein
MVSDRFSSMVASARSGVRSRFGVWVVHFTYGTGCFCILDEKSWKAPFQDHINDCHYLTIAGE